MNEGWKRFHGTDEEVMWRIQVLKRIDNVMEWRFVNALGEVVLDADILAESIDCETLRTMRYCVAEYLKRIEEREAEEESDE